MDGVITAFTAEENEREGSETSQNGNVQTEGRRFEREGEKARREHQGRSSRRKWGQLLVVGGIPPQGEVATSWQASGGVESRLCLLAKSFLDGFHFPRFATHQHQLLFLFNRTLSMYTYPPCYRLFFFAPNLSGDTLVRRVHLPDFPRLC